MAELQDTKATPHTSTAMIWYFAYGSNIRSASMAKRQIRALQAHAVVVPSYILTFDIFGIPYAEPSFASISEYSHPEGKEGNTIPDVHGMAYLLTKADYCRLILSEGSGVGYDEIPVEALLLSDKKRRIQAQTLKAKYPFRPNRAPSLRYMTLMIKGAEENGLPESYIQYLRSLPTFSPSRSRRHLEVVGSRLFLSVFGRAVQALAFTTKLVVNEQGHCPRALGTVIVWFYWFMWMWHDYIHARFCGRGDGDMLSYDGWQLL